MFSCAPKYVYGLGETGSGGAVKLLFGEETAADISVPMRSILDHGLRAVIELDQHAFHPFLALEVVTTRKDRNGKVWGKQQSISRREALYTYTRWAAEYVLRENVLGSIESKKYADFAVLNRDYLTVPEDEIGQIDPVLTVMGGQIVYSDPQFAQSQGLPVAGFQGSRSHWLRGTPQDSRRGR